MNIVQVEDKKKYTKLSGINSAGFISWDSIVFIYFTSRTYCIFVYIYYIYIYIMFTYNIHIYK